jgi:hypothetical protein
MARMDENRNSLVQRLGYLSVGVLLLALVGAVVLLCVLIANLSPGAGRPDTPGFLLQVLTCIACIAGAVLIAWIIRLPNCDERKQLQIAADKKTDKYLHIGGLIAVGFDVTGAYMLAISHAGRGVFSTRTWELLARDRDVAYPTDNIGLGIGPIDGQAITIAELDSDHEIRLMSPDGAFELECESSGIALVATGNRPVHQS